MSGFVFAEKPIALARGSGVHLFDEDGDRYLDFGASYACVPLGHAHPAVREAVTAQLGSLPYAHGSYPVEVRTAAYRRVAALAPDGLDDVWLCNSGTEAVEAALKFVRAATGRAHVVAAMRGFHGRTMGSLSLTWDPGYREGVEPLLPEVEFVPFGDADALVDAVRTDTAAVVLEPIQGEGGVHPAGTRYLRTARGATRAVGAALVLDEIQTGLGRTGEWWACEDAGVTPDVITLAKGLANGLPVGATVVADWVADGIGDHGSTFAGNPAVCAATVATVDRLVVDDLAARAAATGAYLRDRLEGAIDAGALPARGVRGEGLLLGVELKRRVGPVLRELALDHRILALPAGGSVLRLLPPLTVERTHIDELVHGLTEVVA